MDTCENLVLQVAEAKPDANNQIRNSKKLTQVNFKVLFENQFFKRFLYAHRLVLPSFFELWRHARI
jgi:hypothetical protein